MAHRLKRDRESEIEMERERERPHTCWFLTLCAFASLESYTTLFSIVCPDWACHCPQWQLRSLAAAAASSSLPACAISIRICALFSHLREASFCLSDGSSRWCGNSAPCATPTASGNDPWHIWHWQLCHKELFGSIRRVSLVVEYVSISKLYQ